ncbi:MAG: transketolase family protein [Planctomycetaceae bacterium]
MRTAFIETLTELAANDPRVMLVVGDLGFGVVQEFARRFPKQFVNAGVAEQNMTSLAAGLALSGKKVYTYSIANFPTLRCLEQIRNDVCYHDADVTIVAVGGGFAYGALGMTHHATEDLAVLRSLPNLRVVAPGDPLETSVLMRQLYDAPGPSYLRLGRAGEPIVHHKTTSIELGRAATVREGDHLALITTGGMLHTAATVSDRLRRQGHRVRVLSMHSLKPLDAETILQAAAQTGRIVTLEEHSILGGLGGAVAEVLCEAGLNDVSFQRLGVAPQFTSAIGDQQYLQNVHGLSIDEVMNAVLSMRPPDQIGTTAGDGSIIEGVAA